MGGGKGEQGVGVGIPAAETTGGPTGTGPVQIRTCTSFFQASHFLVRVISTVTSYKLLLTIVSPSSSAAHGQLARDTGRPRYEVIFLP